VISNIVGKVFMDRARPSILTALFWAYWDLYHTLQKAWRPALFAFLILSIGTCAMVVGPLLLTRDPIGQAVTGLAILIGLSFLLTPFLLTIHRFLLLGESATRCDFRPSSPRFQLFFGWLALSVLLVTFPSFLGALTAPKNPVYYLSQPSLNDRFTVATAVRLVALFFVQHLLVLFPAVAVDAPGAGWQNAISDTRKHIWFVLAVTILPFIPIGLLGGVVAPLFRPWVGSLIGLIVGTLWVGAMLLVALTLGAVIASRLYQVIGDRLNTPLR
jgi:hypothetical protein